MAFFCLAAVLAGRQAAYANCLTFKGQGDFETDCYAVGGCGFLGFGTCNDYVCFSECTGGPTGGRACASCSTTLCTGC